MPNNVASFYMKNDGDMWVATVSNDHRPATEMEWIEIWKTNPALTLQICANDHGQAALAH
ncbi:MAG: hypothetical protein HOO19_11915 [Rhodospirillaceae bacterium]|jgi:hypothetical protein|nr:hypothetical protein [Rhodospirillaceae bacterium]MBT3887052.1 hypothetical protein [Rhodospirillaceae bacterium]MBT4115716.1 hypothetical protein [Rhodospirillaceae bacterium]MBT4673389.1 hypothetical protein [Rhodospirillaceae bacterium]MBT4719754.1 hypothetical protein [Rhodospirillaceae bacterium]